MSGITPSCVGKTTFKDFWPFNLIFILSMANTLFDNIDLPKLAVLFERCRRCSYVNVDTSFSNGCPNCGSTRGTRGGLSHFSFDTYGLLQLLFDSFSKRPANKKDKAPFLAIIMFFCSLTEVSLYHFLTNLMDQKKIDSNIQTRLLGDSWSTKQRVEKLFPALTGQNWKEAVKLVDTKSNLPYNYSASINFYHKSAVPARNKLVHEGDTWSIPKDLPENCMLHAKQLVLLFVELHNQYVADKGSATHG